MCAEAQDPTEELAALLAAADAPVTFDGGRDNTHPCTFCGKPPASTHDLVTIGRYLNGQSLTRPVCEGCLPRAKAKGAT